MALDRLEFALGDHGQETAVAHDLDDTPGMRSTAPTSTIAQACAIARRPHDARMHHAGQPQVLDIGDAAGDLGRNVDAWHRLADDV